MSEKEVLEAMGNLATDAEAAAMIVVLGERGVKELDEISEQDFFALIPEALQRVGARGRLRNAGYPKNP